MSVPNYSQVPPADFQTISTSYPALPPPSGQDEKKPYTSNEEEHGPGSNSLLASATPHSSFGQAKFKLRTVAHKFWLLEAFASFFSLALFAAIIGVLVWYDQSIYGDASDNSKSPQKRPTIFPVLAFLGAIMRAAMLLGVATAIGQLKWSWFRSGRRLLDLETFDEAARGMLGSAKLIWMLRFRNVAAVGAALTILTLPLDALIQSSVRIPSEMQPNDVEYLNYPGITNETRISRSTWYDDWQAMQSTRDRWPETSLMNAIRFGESYQNGLSSFITAVTLVDCPTGYCSFPKAQTLAVDRVCVDRTNDIVTYPRNGTLAAYKSLPGLDMKFYHEGTRDYEAQVIGTYSAVDYPDDDYMKQVFGAGYRALITRTGIMLQGSTGILGYECALAWSVRQATEYVDDTSNFQLNSTNDIITWSYEFQPNGTDVWWSLEPDTCYVQGEVVHKDESDHYQDNCIFAVGQGAGEGLETMLVDEQDGFMGDLFMINKANQTATRMNSFLLNLNATRTNNNNDAVPSSDKVIFNRINNMWQNIAFAMSFTIRHAPSRMVDGSYQYLTTTGSVDKPVYYYNIDWVRLALPAFVVGFAAFFVGYTAFITRKEYAWRRSALPLLFHGIEDRERVALGDVRSFITMQDVAKKLHVRLEEHVDANGARFATQHQ
ncbi:hypothetical protein EK21DRAFT_108241 [Setomelanomma holmii]|uniref:Uncharacterized protein n=1 Tax=Setomelanomma holmii TaxID=210430 RepID=A0A9P4LNS3_9PLEO|nr:hypothetical protein EK21DRAFT_108241 [Setomelanomma holmii]